MKYLIFLLLRSCFEANRGDELQSHARAPAPRLALTQLNLYLFKYFNTTPNFYTDSRQQIHMWRDARHAQTRHHRSPLRDKERFQQTCQQEHLDHILGEAQLENFC